MGFLGSVLSGLSGSSPDEGDGKKGAKRRQRREKARTASSPYEKPTKKRPRRKAPVNKSGKSGKSETPTDAPSPPAANVLAMEALVAMPNMRIDLERTSVMNSDDCIIGYKVTGSTAEMLVALYANCYALPDEDASTTCLFVLE